MADVEALPSLGGRAAGAAAAASATSLGSATSSFESLLLLGMLSGEYSHEQVEMWDHARGHGLAMVVPIK